MLTLMIIVWIFWSLCRPWYGGLFRPYGGWYRRPMGGWHVHRPPMGGWYHPPMGGFGGGRSFGGHTMGGGAGRGRR